MTGLENQREFGNETFSVSEQSVRHFVAMVSLILATWLTTEFLSSIFLYVVVVAVGIATVIAFLVDIHHNKLSLDDDE